MEEEFVSQEINVDFQKFRNSGRSDAEIVDKLIEYNTNLDFKAFRQEGKTDQEIVDRIIFHGDKLKLFTVPKVDYFIAEIGTTEYKPEDIGIVSDDAEVPGIDNGREGSDLTDISESAFATGIDPTITVVDQTLPQDLKTIDNVVDDSRGGISAFKSKGNFIEVMKQQGVSDKAIEEKLSTTYKNYFDIIEEKSLTDNTIEVLLDYTPVGAAVGLAGTGIYQGGKYLIGKQAERIVKNMSPETISINQQVAKYLKDNDLDPFISHDLPVAGTSPLTFGERKLAERAVVKTNDKGFEMLQKVVKDFKVNKESGQVDTTAFNNAIHKNKPLVERGIKIRNEEKLSKIDKRMKDAVEGGDERLAANIVLEYDSELEEGGKRLKRLNEVSSEVILNKLGLDAGGKFTKKATSEAHKTSQQLAELDKNIKKLEPEEIAMLNTITGGDFRVVSKTIGKAVDMEKRLGDPEVRSLYNRTLHNAMSRGVVSGSIIGGPIGAAVGGGLGFIVKSFSKAKAGMKAKALRKEILKPKGSKEPELPEPELPKPDFETQLGF